MKKITCNNCKNHKGTPTCKEGFSVYDEHAPILCSAYKPIRILNLKFYCDAGHGWLAAKRELIVNVGIADKISRYSFQRGKSVYLEEDGDAPLLIEELKRRGIDFYITSPSKWPDRSPIRSYEEYRGN